jgi:hypothetical protein
MLDSSKELLFKRIDNLEEENAVLIAEKSRLTRLVTFQRDTITNLRNVGIGMRKRIVELTSGI